MKEYVQDFLDSCGYELGYDMNILPEFSHIEYVRDYNVPVWDYNGKTKEEYYGGAK